MPSIWISILQHLHNRTIQQHNMPETDLQIYDHVLPPYGLLMSHLWTCVLEKKQSTCERQVPPDSTSAHGFPAWVSGHSLGARTEKRNGITTRRTILKNTWNFRHHYHLVVVTTATQKKSMIICHKQRNHENHLLTSELSMDLRSSTLKVGWLVNNEYLSDFILPLRKPIVSFAHTTGHFCRAASGTNIFQGRKEHVYSTQQTQQTHLLRWEVSYHVFSAVVMLNDWKCRGASGLDST